MSDSRQLMTLESRAAAPAAPDLEIGLLTGGVDKPYTWGLAEALSGQGIRMDFIGSDEIDGPGLRALPGLDFLNLRGDQGPATLVSKVWRVLRYYALLIGYALSAKPKVFHILWNNRWETFDRTVLMLFYKILRKKIVLTAHNVNSGKRDGSDSFLNRLTLRIQYSLCDHIFVHTDAMKQELVRDFRIAGHLVTVIPFGVNNAAPRTSLTHREARVRLGVEPEHKTILFFGHVRPYKGVEYLVQAFQKRWELDNSYRLVIAGQPERGHDEYVNKLEAMIGGHPSRDCVVQKFTFIPDEDTEVYFKAADILALPYTDVSQSGVLLLGYSFGLPAIASEVGSFREDIEEGRTGYMCRPCDADSLADRLDAFFTGDMYSELEQRRDDIRDLANRRNSWSVVGAMTRAVYTSLTPARAGAERQAATPSPAAAGTNFSDYERDLQNGSESRRKRA